MLKTFSKVTIKDTAAFKAFHETLSLDTSMPDFAVRFFEGELKGHETGEIHIRSSDPVIWRNMWEMLGFTSPPTQLPPDCKFEFMTVSRPHFDTDITLKNALRTTKGIDLTWTCKQRKAPPVRPERAHYHMLILPKTDVRSTLEYS